MKKTFDIAYTPCDRDGGFSFGNADSGYSATPRYLTHHGKPILPICGEIHFSRCEREDWGRELMKMRECGLTAVSVYVFWNHHEQKKGVFCWNGNRDIAHFLALCHKCGLQVILRIGPWCHGEARFGGFPDWLAPLPGKRRDSAVYLKYVERYWRALYGQVGEFCDGKTILGIQLENEYPGKIGHIHTLRRLAEKIGFQTPYFTMTAWPTNTPDSCFLPMMGGYPEAPWTQNKKPLSPAGRFAICAGRTETEIGEDLAKSARKHVSFDAFPYAGCEVGTGNQVTQHRRPVIHERDGYGVAFAKFASGMNLMGYYMFHGGRNPRGALLQESRRTLYPNNYPVIDYDFQAPLSKDGVCRKHGDRLRLLHLFINTWHAGLARKQPFFPSEQGLPYASVRCGKDGEGYLFVGNYERGAKCVSQTFRAELRDATSVFCLPELEIAGGEMVFLPFRFQVGNWCIDYVTAQPVVRVEQNGKTNLYFMRMEKQPVMVSVAGKVIRCDGESMELDDTVCLHFMDRERAVRFHIVKGSPVFCEGTMWVDSGRVNALLEDGASVEIGGQKHTCRTGAVEECASLNRIEKVRLPYGRYLYSHGKRGYYRLTVRLDKLMMFDDLILDLRFCGLNLQVFCGGVLVDDYFNTDGGYSLHTRHFQKLLLENFGEILIRTVSATAHGVGNVYSEIELPPQKEGLVLERIRPVVLEKFDLPR